MLQNGVSHRCACVKLSTKGGGVSHHSGGVLTLPEKVSRDMGYRSDSIAVSRNMGPLSLQLVALGHQRAQVLCPCQTAWDVPM